jgi:hypothetical protein
VAITTAAMNYKIEKTIYQLQVDKTSVKDRVYKFMSDRDNYSKAASKNKLYSFVDKKLLFS